MDSHDSKTDTFTTTEFDAESRCRYCFLNFGSPFILQAHLATQSHPDLKTLKSLGHNPLDKHRLKFKCNVCCSTLHPDSLSSHRCMTKLSDELSRSSCQFLYCGSPFACLYCKGRPQVSRCHLLIHLIVQHCKRSNHHICPLCGAVFKTTSRSVIEMHAFQVHVPEYLILVRKAMKQTNVTRTPANSPFLCLHQTHKSHIKKKNCDLSFSNLAQFTAHVISQHSTCDLQKLNQSVHHLCQCCAQAFNDEPTLKHHIAVSHERDASTRLKRVLSMPAKDSDSNVQWQICFICWHKFPNPDHLQAHVVCAHSSPSWQFCGLCHREYCKEDEPITAAILWMFIKAHEIHHAKHLKRHFEDHIDEERTIASEYEAVSPKQSGSSVYFSNVNVVDWKALQRRVSNKSSLHERWEKIGRKNSEYQQLFDDDIL